MLFNYAISKANHISIDLSSPWIDNIITNNYNAIFKTNVTNYSPSAIEKRSTVTRGDGDARFAETILYVRLSVYTGAVMHL
jgi:hypothetical protein